MTTTTQKAESPVAPGPHATNQNSPLNFTAEQKRLATLLNESNIPPEHLPKARAWFQRQMDRCAEKHGDKWPEHREWLADYLNEELREHLEKKGGHHGV